MAEPDVTVEVAEPEITVEIDAPEISESDEVIEPVAAVPEIVVVNEPTPTEQVADALGMAEQLRNIVREEVGSAVTSLTALIHTHNHPEYDHSNDPPSLPPAEVVDNDESEESQPVHPWFRPIGKRKK